MGSGKRLASVRSSPLLISTVVAIFYAAFGLLTLRLAQMTGLASPVWPSAGIAFAAVLRWRWRALPGVFIGSVAANVFSLALVGVPVGQSWPAAAIIGVGAVLGAAVGAALVHRFVGPVPRLDTPRAVLLTLTLGGLVATTIAPSIGLAAQLANGLLNVSQAAFGWLTWWVGDSIGVIVFAPLTLMFLPSQAEYWSGRRWQIAIPSIVIFGILIGGIAQNIGHERTRIDSAVKLLGDHAAADLGGNLAVHEEVLEGLRGLLDTSDQVSGQQFNAYVRDILQRFPNLQALSWNPLVKRGNLASFEARQR